MALTKEITTKQYADYLGCTPQNISKHIRLTGKKNLADVININYYSRFVTLVVSASLPVRKDSEIPTKKYIKS